MEGVVSPLVISRRAGADHNGGQMTSAAVPYEFAFGSYEEALAMVGHRSVRRVAPAAVSGARIQLFASAVRDSNPAYWDVDFAQRRWGALLAPPALLMGWLVPPPWQPTGALPTPALCARVPLPGTTFINASNEAEFFDVIRDGDQISAIEELTSVSPEKTTKMGVGHFVSTSDRYYRDDDQLVAVNHNTLFRFTPTNHLSSAGDGLAAIAAQRPQNTHGLNETSTVRREQTPLAWDGITVGDSLPVVTDDELTYQRVIMTPAITWDFFAAHFDPEYARAQGHPTIFINTMHTAGFVDRVSTGWWGPAARVIRRRLRLLSAFYAGDTMAARCRITDKQMSADTGATDGTSRMTVSLEVDVFNQRSDVCARADVVVDVTDGISALSTATAHRYEP